jgi:hypothetical protein
MTRHGQASHGQATSKVSLTRGNWAAIGSMFLTLGGGVAGTLYRVHTGAVSSENRLTKIETTVESHSRDIVEIKNDVRELRPQQ